MSDLIGRTEEKALMQDFSEQVSSRLSQLAETADAGGFDAAVQLFADAVRAGGVIQAFGTGHSEAFAMEIAGRAGGLIPTSRITLRALVLRGGYQPEILTGSALERNPEVIGDLLSLYPIDPRDVFLIASNSGVNGSIVELALAVKARGHKLIAVTSLAHTNAVEPKHSSGKRLSEVADVVIDNLAPFGDTTLTTADGTGVGAVSSLTAAYIAQLLTIGTAAKLAESGERPPFYISANVPGGDEHNNALEDLYAERIRQVS
ncbi:SIS domain-containing protein [Arthrobacter russicus]|uniref:Phosphosugar-binding protein n=1 Tax=Arthrobacter russicus TaxID=172040 RepID=A0ABU1JC03_9MICC|nr:SIS domain-containing protein [Arthrobacter russicus]MDR6269684.1 putative phosphosugar-binding protein [Arthrobacter russicus]